jgi:hypothetical protein
MVLQPAATPVRFECPTRDTGKLGAHLPEMLVDLGYKPRSNGDTEKLLPVTEVTSEYGRKEKITRDQVKPVMVAIMNLICRCGDYDATYSLVAHVGKGDFGRAGRCGHGL